MLRSSQLTLGLHGIAVIAALLVSGVAGAEEVRIGHLETKDDTGINWLYFRCEKPAATKMRCDVFQTLIYRAKSDAKIDTELKQQASMDLLAEFNRNFGKGCKSLIENEGKIKAGIGIDGKPIDPRTAGAFSSAIKVMIEACKAQTQESAADFFKSMLSKTGEAAKYIMTTRR